MRVDFSVRLVARVIRIEYLINVGRTFFVIDVGCASKFKILLQWDFDIFAFAQNFIRKVGDWLTGSIVEDKEPYQKEFDRHFLFTIII